MRRYCTKPRSVRDDWDRDWDANGADFLARTIYEPDPTPRPTGLLDVQGNELYAVEEMESVGYINLNKLRRDG